MRMVAALTLFSLLFCTGLALAGSALTRRRRWWATALRVVVGIGLFAAYAYAVLRLTIIGRDLTAGRQKELTLFLTHRESLSLAGGELSVTNVGLLKHIVLNVLLFTPFGALLPFVLSRTCASRSVVASGILVAGLAFCCSLAIELTQWRFCLGVFELDDLFDNVVGAALGYLLYRVFYHPGPAAPPTGVGRYAPA